MRGSPGGVQRELSFFLPTSQAVVASLIVQNKLALSDSIGEYIPEFPSYGKSITIENLLFHTGGIRDYTVLMWLTVPTF